MSRDAIIFGNGLGMALDPDHFALQNAIERVGKNHLEAKFREIVSHSAGRTDETLPVSEDELERLHLIVNSCEYLQMIFPEKVDSILTEYGLKLPKVIQRFMHAVATDLFEYCGKLPNAFTKRLIESIKKNNHNIITLNYDGLLYKEFINEGVCKGFDGNLVDGILDGGFKPENLERRYGKTFGLYLHLHGSPLFYGSDIVRKYNINGIDKDSEKEHKHIVLTHVNQKMSVIEKSNILKSYWDSLPYCLREAEEVHLFGYSGYDIHLNESIMNTCHDKQVNIIEWSGSVEKPGHDGKIYRDRFWNNKLSRCNKIKVIHLDNILEGPYTETKFLDC